MINIKLKKLKIILLLLILSAFFYPINLTNGYNSQISNPDLNWYDSNWLYRAEIQLEPYEGSTLVDYVIKIPIFGFLNYSLVQENGEDIRFTDKNNEILSFWIEKWNEDENSIIWVKIPLITSSFVTTIYMYYGNPSAMPTSNGGDVFSLFEDFENQNTGEEPNGWYIKQQEWGSFNINNDGRTGNNCGYYIDNSTLGSCRFYKALSENIIGKVLEFWIKPKSNSNSGILYYNDGNDSYDGGNIDFGFLSPNTISYQDTTYRSIYSPYYAENWYFISIQLKSTSYYSQKIYDVNGSLLKSTDDLDYCGNPDEITYFMNGGSTLSFMEFDIDAIRYRDFVYNEPAIEAIDPQQINMPTTSIILPVSFEIFTIIAVNVFSFSIICKKRKKVQS